MCVEVALQCGSDWVDRVHAAVADGVPSEQKPEVMSPRASQPDYNLFSMSGDPIPSPFKATPSTAHAPSSSIVCDCDPSKTPQHICDPESSGLFFTSVPSKSCEKITDSALSEVPAPSAGHTSQERERLLTSQNHWLKSTLIKVLERYSQQLASNKRQRQLMTRLLELRKQRLNSPPARQQQKQQQQQQEQHQQLKLLHDQRQELYSKYEHLVRRNSQLERALKQVHRQAALAPPPAASAPTPQPVKDEMAEYRAMVKLQITSAVDDYRAEKAEKERALQLNAQLHQRVEELTRQLQLLQEQQQPQVPAVRPQSGGRQPAARSGSGTGTAPGGTPGHLWARQNRSPLPPPGHPMLRHSGSLPSRQPPESPQSVASRSVDEILAAPYQPVHVVPPPEPPPYDEVQIDLSSEDRHKMFLVDSSGRLCRAPGRLPRTPEEVSESVDLRAAAVAGVEERGGRRSAVDLLLDQSLPEQLPPALLDDPAALLEQLRELVPPAAAGEERRAPQAAAGQQGRRGSTVRDSGYSESQARGEEAVGALLRGWRPGGTLSALTDVSGGPCENVSPPSVGDEASWRTGVATQLSGEYGDINSEGVKNGEADAHLIRTNSSNSCSSHVRTSPSGDNRIRSKRDGVAYYPSETNPRARGASNTRDSFISAMGEWTVVGDSLLPATLPGRSELPATLPEGSPEASEPTARGSSVSSKLHVPADISVDEYIATNTRTDVICPHCGRVFPHSNNLAYLDHIEVCPVRRVVTR